MDGKTLAKICDTECLKRDMSKADFYAAIGLSAASFHGWKNGAKPTQKYIDAIEKLFSIDLADYEKSEQLEDLRDDLRILLRSASDLPPSSIYQLIAQIEREKEQNSVLPN